MDDITNATARQLRAFIERIERLEEERRGLGEDVRDVYGEAKGIEAETIWLSQHLNIEIGMATHDGRWAGADHWAAAAVKPFTLEGLLARCEVATIGIDGGGLDDLLGVCVLGRERQAQEEVLSLYLQALGMEG